MSSRFIAEAPVAKLSTEARSLAQERQSQLTKPLGSLGRLEEIALKFAAWQNTEKPVISKVALRIYAADHGIAAPKEDFSVSAFPQEVTAQMVHNFSSGGAAICQLARQQDFDFKVLNMGTVKPLPELASVISIPQASGTCDFTETEAMTADQLQACLQAGADSVPQDAQLFIGGEMGIGNTTSASALMAALLGLKGADVAGRGTGISDKVLAYKIACIDKALVLHGNATSALDKLRCMGGLEIAALVGAYIRAAQLGIPVLIDGFITTVAAALAIEINPEVGDWMLFSHCSAERAHREILAYLDAKALLDLQMRLGEASGAATAVPIIQLALLVHSQMHTFAEAGVTHA